MARIFKVMELSTANSPQRVWEPDFEWKGTTCVMTDYGGWVLVPTEDDCADALREHIPELVEAFTKAFTKGCEWILFDADADVDETLPKWEW